MSPTPTRRRTDPIHYEVEGRATVVHIQLRGRRYEWKVFGPLGRSRTRHGWCEGPMGKHNPTTLGEGYTRTLWGARREVSKALEWAPPRGAPKPPPPPQWWEPMGGMPPARPLTTAGDEGGPWVRETSRPPDGTRPVGAPPAPRYFDGEDELAWSAIPYPPRREPFELYWCPFMLTTGNPCGHLQGYPGRCPVDHGSGPYRADLMVTMVQKVDPVEDHTARKFVIQAAKIYVFKSLASHSGKVEDVAEADIAVRLHPGGTGTVIKNRWGHVYDLGHRPAEVLAGFFESI